MGEEVRTTEETNPEKNGGVSPSSSSSSSCSIEQKHMAMLSRLAAKQEARMQESAARRAGSAAQSSPLESTESFLQAFSEGCRSVETALLSIREKTPAVSSGSDQASIKAELDTLSVKISELEKLVAEKAYFLPAYEVRTSQATIAGLRAQVAAAQGDLVPKKRFSFRGKAGKGTASTEMSAPGVLQGTKREIQGSDGPAESAPSVLQGMKHEGQGSDGPAELEREDNVSSAAQAFLSKYGIATASPYGDGVKLSQGSLTCSIQHLENSIIVRDLQDQNDGEVVLEDLINCKVYMKGCCRALYAHKLKGCHVYMGPVTGSALIEEVEDCVLMLASHQIRIHQTKSTDLYLRVRSRPIVEYTNGVRVAPYAFSYDGVEDDLRAANLQEENGLWKLVDDFRWLRAVPSPNWSVLPEDQRLPRVDGTAVLWKKI